jgi:membrane protein
VLTALSKFGGMTQTLLARIGSLFHRTGLGWARGSAMVHAAAIAYWLILSAVPLLLVSITIASQIFSRRLIEWQILNHVERGMGSVMAVSVESMLTSAPSLSSSGVVTVLTILFLLYSASNVFIQLQTSLDAMWGITLRASNVRESIFFVVKTRLLAALAVLSVGLLLLVSLLLARLWTALPQELLAPILDYLGQSANLLRLATSPVVYTLLFTLVFKALPHAKVRWRDIVPGAALTALLFWLGGYLIGIYLGISRLASFYGAAGSLIVLLLWAYYSAWIILFGAKFTQVYAQEFGIPIRPYTYAYYLRQTIADLPEIDV